MFAACAAVAAAAKNADLINKIIFLQYLIFAVSCKYTLSIFKPLLNEIPSTDAVFAFLTCLTMQ
jgi:hypothetical protein